VLLPGDLARGITGSVMLVLGVIVRTHLRPSFPGLD
jgi:hypothetical protein